MSKSIPEEIGSYSTLLHYTDIEMRVKNMAGRILTIIDASISDKQQNKALKDLIKGEIRETLFGFQHVASDGKAGHSISFE